MTIQQWLQQATQQLISVTDQPSLEAEILLSFALDVPRSFLHAWPEITLAKEKINHLASLQNRRLQREPIAYLVGKKEFWSLDLDVDQNTLIPRPETELLVESVLLQFANIHHPIKVADLGTGSGAIALALAREQPTWQICATDSSDKALALASKNAQRLALMNISFYRGHWCDALPNQDFDAIVSNPPYIAESEWEEFAEGLKFEPRNALVSGQDGLLAIREIIQSVKQYLKPGGSVLIEHGFLQGAAVRQLFSEGGFKDIDSICDLAGHSRVTVAKNSSASC